MKYPIVEVKTKDGLWLYGLLLEAEKSETVFMHTHGTASNFYEENFIEILSEKLVENGISLLSFNNRGAGVYDAYQGSGAATEKFEGCLDDIDTWIEFVINKGYKNIILSGHSLGTEKIVYYMGNGKYKDKVSLMVLLGPADSVGSHYFNNGERNIEVTKEINDLIEKSEKLIKEGKGDEFLPKRAYARGIMPKSALSFVDFFGEGSKITEALPFYKSKLETFSGVSIPILAVIGDQEEFTSLPIKDALKLLETENKNAETYQIENCDHDFDGKEGKLSEIVIDFLKKNNLPLK